ncbi:MAG: penicillin-binding protein 2 [Syntrophomonas sp.]|nr:penicillin-binding protein 2 [Syntrophomonas sp.]
MKQLELKTKLKIYAYIIIGLLSVLCFRLVIVQLVYSEEYQTKAKENRIRLVSIKAPRGEIYDRNGETLAANQLVYTLSLTYPGIIEQDQIVEKLATIINPYNPEITVASIKEKIELQKFRLFEPVIIVRDIPWDLVVKMEEDRKSLPGVAVTIEPFRVYPQDSLAGHVLGYIHSINSEELANASEKYNLNSLIGKSGIEKQYENELRGQDGARRVEVDAKGRPVGELVTLEPVPGNNLNLTLDLKLQTVMEHSLQTHLTRLQSKYPKARVGSAVLMDVKTGEILSMSSSPALRPDDWKGNISSQLAAYYFPQGTAYKPLDPGAALNRAIQVTYPPGSTFKPITGMAALESGTIDPLSDLVNCKGAYWIAPYIPCTGVHGNLNYYSGMARSCNTYFQEIGRRAGNETIIKVAHEFGLGAKTGIDLPFEAQGLVPTPTWKKDLNDLLINRKYDSLRKQLEAKYDQLLSAATDEKTKNDLEKQKKNEKAKLEEQYRIDYNFDTNWQSFDTFNMSIGQGANHYTVMELANYVATIANGGDLLRPHILKSITNPDKKVLLENDKELIKQVAVTPRTLAETKRAMVQVTQPGGTASFLFGDFPSAIQVGAKTGTAQTNRVGDNQLSEFHGVFIAFAPADDPMVAFAGVVEYGQHGSDSAGWVAKEVFEQYFGLKDHYAQIIAQKASAKTDDKTSRNQ